MLPWSELSDQQLDAALRQRSWSSEDLIHRRAFSYPYQGMPFSYLLTAGGVFPFFNYDPKDLGASEVILHGQRIAAQALIDESIDLQEPRVPVLSYGANGHPETLARKLAGSVVPVFCGQIEDFEIGYSAHFSSYGALPATIFPSPGSQVRAYLHLLTKRQFEALADTEANYLWAEIPGEKFQAEELASPERMMTFVSRHGLLAIADRPRALAAVPAFSRHHPTWSERQALSATSSLLGLPGPEHLVDRITADYSWALDQLPILGQQSRQIEIDCGARPRFA